MRPALFLLASLLALAGFAADSPADTPAKKPGRQAKGANILPETVTGVDNAELGKIRQALTATFQEEAIVAARKRLNDVRERGRFTKGRNEAEDLRLDAEKARDTLVKLTLDAALKHDPSLSKDAVVLTLNAIEETVKKRGQEAQQKAREKAAAEEKLAKKDAPAEKPAAPVAQAEPAKPLTPAQLLADVEGVSADDMKKFRLAAAAAQRDAAVKELKVKQQEMRKQAEFASNDEKKGMRGEFEALMTDLRKAQIAAVTKAAPSLSKETIEKIMDAIEERAKAAAKKAPAKAGKTPLKPFPFGEKK
jgi:flagellar biosynthesis GTPase FlhF